MVKMMVVVVVVAMERVPLTRGWAAPIMNGLSSGGGDNGGGDGGDDGCCSGKSSSDQGLARPLNN